MLLPQLYYVLNSIRLIFSRHINTFFYFSISIHNIWFIHNCLQITPTPSPLPFNATRRSAIYPYVATDYSVSSSHFLTLPIKLFSRPHLGNFYPISIVPNPETIPSRCVSNNDKAHLLPPLLYFQSADLHPIFV